MTCKAFLVGINKYRLPGSDLQGCVNDVTNVRDVLIRYFGFRVKDIRVLVDTRATKKAILDRLIWLVKGVKSGDRLSCFIFPATALRFGTGTGMN